MKPLINLKSFMAVLLILIVPAALLVAYFRNYSTEGAGHEHGEKGKGAGTDMGKGEMSAMKPRGDSKAAMRHGNMAMPQGGKMQPQQQAEMSEPAAQPQKDGGHAAMGHDKTQSSDAAGTNKHGAMPEKAAETIPLPDTLEGVWKVIHAYHGELESAVNAKNFGEAQSGAKTLGALAKRLVEVAPAEHKPIVESGVTKITQALDELKSSAETGSDSVMKTRFKEFQQALEQLEQQMKKP